MVLSKYRDIIPNTSSTGKLEGSVDFDLEGPNSKTVERLSILLVPIPGESDWSIQYFESLKDNQHKEQLQQQGQINKDRKRSPDNDTSDSIDNDFKQRKSCLHLHLILMITTITPVEMTVIKIQIVAKLKSTQLTYHVWLSSTIMMLSKKVLD